MNTAEYERLLKEVMAGGPGACDKTSTCQFAAEACRLTYNLGALLPRKRYLLCFAWTNPQEISRRIGKT